jgi:RNA polymerase sigma factor (sigma-70 family)
VEAGALTPTTAAPVTAAPAAAPTRAGLLGGRSPLLRLQSDERLIALMRAGNAGAFDVLFGRYRTRLLAFCRHMLGSKEDAEDVLQDVFAAAYNAILADERAIYARPWLYRIARNRCLNHLRRPVADGRDTMDDQLSQGGASTADVVQGRDDLEHLLADVQKLPETQRTALLLREIDALSYDQIAMAMDTTVPSVKSLLVRARVSLAEASEARLLTCEEVREQLAEVAEGLRRTSPPLKRHVRECEQCATFRKQLRKTSATMAAVFPVGPVLILKKLLLAKAGAAAFAGGGGGGAAAAGGAAGATGGMAAAGAGGAAAGGIAAGGATAGGIAAGGAVGAVTSKAIAGIAVTAILAGGAVEAKKAVREDPLPPAPVHAIAPVKPPAQTGGSALPSEATPPLAKPAAHPADAVPVEDAAAKDPAATDKATTGASGATGTTDTNRSGGAATGATGPQTGPTSPAAGNSSSGVDTGGATAPPPGTKPAPAPPVSGSTSPEQPATGATGPQPPTQ